MSRRLRTFLCPVLVQALPFMSVLPSCSYLSLPHLGSGSSLHVCLAVLFLPFFASSWFRLFPSCLSCRLVLTFLCLILVQALPFMSVLSPCYDLSLPHLGSGSSLHVCLVVLFLPLFAPSCRSQGAKWSKPLVVIVGSVSPWSFTCDKEIKEQQQ